MAESTVSATDTLRYSRDSKPVQRACLVYSPKWSCRPVTLRDSRFRKTQSYLLDDDKVVPGEGV